MPKNLTNTQADAITGVLQRVYEKFLVNETYLMEIGENERSMTHKIAEYLQQEFPSWHVDCEYNRMEADSKKINLDDKPSNVCPDIIVHQRGTSNILSSLRLSQPVLRQSVMSRS